MEQSKTQGWAAGLRGRWRVETGEAATRHGPPCFQMEEMGRWQRSGFARLPLAPRQFIWSVFSEGVFLRLVPVDRGAKEKGSHLALVGILDDNLVVVG